MTDFNDIIMPCCPICDNAIEDWEPHVVISGQGAKGLAHLICAEVDDEDEDQ